MDYKEQIKIIEDCLFDNEDFLKVLPIVKEEYWSKAKQGKKMEFLKIFNNCIADAYGESYPRKVKAVDKMEEIAGGVQDFFIGEDCVYVAKALVNNDISAYALLKSYFKELFISENIIDARSDETGADLEAYKINLAVSYLGEWDNFIFDRTNPDFILQPVIYDAFVR